MSLTLASCPDAKFPRSSRKKDSSRLLECEAKIFGDQVKAQLFHLFKCQCVDLGPLLVCKVCPVSASTFPVCAFLAVGLCDVKAFRSNYGTLTGSLIRTGGQNSLAHRAGSTRTHSHQHVGVSLASAKHSSCWLSWSVSSWWFWPLVSSSRIWRPVFSWWAVDFYTDIKLRQT